MLYSRLVEGRYPDYRQIFPKKPAVKATVTAAPFLVAVRQAAVMVDAETKRVAFRFAFVYLIAYNLPFPLDALPIPFRAVRDKK